MDPVNAAVARYGLFVSAELTLAMPLYRLTTTQRDVWDTILGWMQPGGLVPCTRGDIATRLSINPNTVSSALSRLAELRLVWRENQKLLQVNPNAAYRSANADPQEWLRATQEAPPLIVPDYKRRPPRRDDGRAKNRQLRAV